MLPKRNLTKPTKFEHADKYLFYTNYYQVIMEKKRSHIYQYYLESDIPADSTEVLYKVIRSLGKELREKIGLLSFRGNMLWGSKSNNLALTMIAKIQVDQKDQTYEVMIKQSKELDVDEIMKNPEDASKMIQVLNIDTKLKMKKLKMV